MSIGNKRMESSMIKYDLKKATNNGLLTKFLASIHILILAFYLIGCGEDSKKSSSAENTTSSFLSSLAGTWKTSCLSGMVVTLTITNNIQKQTTVKYSDSSCLTPIVTLTEEGTFTLEGEVSGVANTYKKNSTTTAVKAMMLSNEAVTEANSDSYFGYTDWVKNVEKDVAGKKATSDSDTTQSTIGTIVYTIVKVQDNKWYMPDTAINDGSSEAKRPTSIKTDVYLTKQ